MQHGDQSSGYCYYGCLSGDCQQARQPDGQAAALAAEYDGGNLGNTKLTTELTTNVAKADAAELHELDGKVFENSMMHCRTLTRDSFVCIN